MESLNHIELKLKSSLEQYGFETYPFLLDWYNRLVGPRFMIPCVTGTVAFIIISTPKMFENNLVPFLASLDAEEIINADLLDESIKRRLNSVVSELPGNPDNVEVIHDFDLHHNHRPKVLVQTAGHVAGAVHFYQRGDVSPTCDPWPADKNIYGCAVHPKYCGWFALRAVIILRDTQCPSLIQPRAPDPLKSSPELIVDLLDKFNTDWRDYTFRDVIPVVDRYSQHQCKYFLTAPANRLALIEQWRTDGFI